jgi:hypothetical protein
VARTVNCNGKPILSTVSVPRVPTGTIGPLEV